MSFTVTGADRIREAARNIEQLFSSSALTATAIALAKQAGVMLKEAVVQQCVDEIYELSGSAAPYTPRTLPGLAEALGAAYGGLPEDRTEALQRAHQVVDEGLKQTVRIDPYAAAEPDPRNNRATVMDYAEHVHEGYTQWVMGHNTGVYHMGRPWFKHAVEKHGEEVVEFVTRAFAVAVESAMARV